MSLTRKQKKFKKEKTSFRDFFPIFLHQFLLFHIEKNRFLLLLENYTSIQNSNIYILVHTTILVKLKNNLQKCICRGEKNGNGFCY